MIDVIAPMQILPMKTVVERDNTFHLIMSATLGIDLSNNNALLSFDYIKDALESMDRPPMLDMGMPKPHGEFMVSGKFFAPNQQAVDAGEVKVCIGDQQKSLYVFGPRSWQAGFPSKPEPIESLLLDYQFAMGGDNYPENPEGMGYEQEQLPQIEYPNQLVDSPKAQVSPAGLSAIDITNPQRAQYHGTYDGQYLEKYFPGYPADMDWRMFMCTPPDQWSKGFYNGDEKFSLHNMHPNEALIEGQLPSLKTRCFLRSKPGVAQQSNIQEIPMNLDTVWFFPEVKIALLIARGGIEINDDEGDDFDTVLFAYERHDEVRSPDYYKEAMDLRLDTKDRLLYNLCTHDLIPSDHKSAMETLQLMGEESADNSEFSKNLAHKTESIQNEVDEKVEKALKQSEEQMAAANIGEEHKPDIRAILKEPKTDPEIEALNAKLEKILPGITGKDGKSLELKNLTSAKIEEVIQTSKEFSDKKNEEAQQMIREELLKIRQELKDQLKMELPEESKKSLEQALTVIEGMLESEPPPTELPRVDSQALIDRFQQASPESMQYMQQIALMRASGGDEKAISVLEKQLKDLEDFKENEMKTALIEAEKTFKDGYLKGAHYTAKGLSPHEDDATVRGQLIKKISLREDVSQQDWACLDLSAQDLAGVDFSGCYLEQVDFSGADLSGANFSQANLARAKLENANCIGANFEGANLGAVLGNGCNFTDATLHEAQLNLSDFQNSNFTRAKLDLALILEINVDGANFSEAQLEKVQFLDIELNDVDFSNANLVSAVFINCIINRVNFSGAKASSTIWTNIPFTDVKFDDADITSACFAPSEEGKTSMESVSLVRAIMDKSNFQGMPMQSCDLTEASMENAIMMEADLKGANLTGIKAKGASFRKASLENALLKNADLRDGILSKANLVGANFVGANLFRADLIRSSMKNTDFLASNLDATLIKDWRPS